MQRLLFDSEWKSLRAQWREHATPELAEVWWREFSGLTDTQFQGLVDGLLRTCKYMPTVKDASAALTSLCAPAVANKDAISLYLAHAALYACGYAPFLSQIRTNKTWPAGITNDNLPELKALLDAVHKAPPNEVDACFCISVYRASINRYGMSPDGIDRALAELTTQWGKMVADMIVAKARAAMPEVDQMSSAPVPDDPNPPAPRVELPITKAKEPDLVPIGRELAHVGQDEDPAGWWVDK